VTLPVTIATYSLELLGPPDPRRLGPLIQTPIGIAAPLLREIEENVTDLLPEGFSVRVREWSSDE
jgi:hypothetical protein